MCSSERIFTLISTGSKLNTIAGTDDYNLHESAKTGAPSSKGRELGNQRHSGSGIHAHAPLQSPSRSRTGNHCYANRRLDSIKIEEINDDLFIVMDCRLHGLDQNKVTLDKENKDQTFLSGIFKSDSQRTGVKIVDLEVGYSDISGASYSVVLDGINADIRPFEKIGIVGRTGSGKSTLILALLGLVKYNKGQILLDETPISMLSIKERRRLIGVLPQTPLLLKGWTVRAFLDPYGEFTDEEISAGLDKCLPDPSLLSEIKSNLYSNAGFLSGSQLRYLSIAKLVINSKHYRMILIDEPPPNTSGDHGLQQNLSRVLDTHFKHCNIFIVAHHAESIKDCDTIWILAQQKIVKSIHPRSIPTQNELAQILTSYE
ncbi:hypothetical protein OJ252_2985 [Cryptosporidium canis]|uniref:ABC transporter domain-containing protein n=1 Tax=Cryptosporidium canis TaxID=195482 RepID=A0ABQ8P4L3_9CRYT|nr:hypothetical protein OJ252_2985 [Cryptosporidium canis]